MVLGAEINNQHIILKIIRIKYYLFRKQCDPVLRNLPVSNALHQLTDHKVC